MTSHLLGSDFTGGAPLPHYVNGRLLTAEDLVTGQATLRTRDRRLGRAAGHGIVDGLWVSSGATTLTVAAGLGVAPSGDIISVGAAVTLPLTFTASAGNPPVGGAFSCCTSKAVTGGGTALTAGCYLLTALPACQLSGQAPLAGTPGSTAPAGCAAQWEVEGVQFKTVALPLGNSFAGIGVTNANRRNLLAHWCFGSHQLSTLGADPFGFDPAYSGLDKLDPADLSDVDLPLAVFYWDGQAIGFVDNWSVRRRITAPDAFTPATAAWSGVLSDRRVADGHARLLQFQDQATELVASGAAGTVAATTTLPLLPPVGFLPVGAQPVTAVFDRFKEVAAKVQTGEAKSAEGARLSMFAMDHHSVLRNLALVSKQHLETVGGALADTPPQPGFDLAIFFGTAATCGGILDWEVADFALRQSWGSTAARPQPPAPDQPAPMIFYLVMQNLNALPGGAGSARPRFYAVFLKKDIWVPGTQLPFATNVSSLPTP